jgi:hypothetical protein
LNGSFFYERGTLCESSGNVVLLDAKSIERMKKEMEESCELI